MAASPAHARLRAFVLAPRGRDAALVAEALAQMDVVPTPVADVEMLCAALGAADAGLGVVTEDVLTQSNVRRLRRTIRDQPGWSAIPVLAFIDAGRDPSALAQVAPALGGQGVTVLERPLRKTEFETVVRFALLARRQQFEIRDLLARMADLNTDLQARVDAQTATLRERSARIEALALAVTEAEDRERERIAELLHDDLQQVLFGIQLLLSSVADAPTTPDIERIAGHVDQAIEQTRLLTTELYPPTASGEDLGPALRVAADLARQRYGLRVHLDLSPADESPSRAVLDALARAARELLFNVVKHAGTAEAWLACWTDADGHHLRVRDQGQGQSAHSDGGTGRGLAALRNRVELAGGRVEVVGRPGEGFTVAVSLPRET